MSEKIDFKLTVSDDELSKALDKNTKQAKSLGSALDVAIGAFGAGIALKGVELLADGFRSLTGFVKDSIDAASGAEESQNRLKVALSQTGILTEQNIKSFRDFASQIQETTAFEDDAVTSSAALIQSLARLDSDGLKRATAAALDLASTFNIDLDTASRVVGKAAEGNTTALGKLGVEFVKGANDAQTFSNVLGAIESRFGGAAQAQAKTFSGAVAQLNNQWGELKETVGGVIVQNTAVIAAFRVISAVISGLAQSFSDVFSGANSDAVADLFRLIIDGSNAVVLSVDAVIRVFDILANITVGSFEVIKGALLGPVVGVLNLLELIPGIGDKFGEASRKASGDLDQLADSVKKRAEDVKNSFSGETFLSGVSSKIADVRSNFDVLYSEIKNKSEDLKNNPVKVFGVEDEGQLARINEAKIALLEAESNYYLQKNQLDQENEILERERFFARTEDQIKLLADFELTKSELQYQAAVKRANLLGTEQEKELARNKAFFDKQSRDEKTNQKIKSDIRATEIRDQQAFFSTAATLASSSNKTFAAIGKAAAITEIAIKTPQAIASSFAFGAKIGGPALGAALGAIAATAMSVQAARVAGIQGFADGGIVGATQGPDNQLATVRTGEMLLNAEQQKKLFDMINSGNQGSGDIVINVDGKEIARAVRNQVRSGFNLGVA